MAGGRGEGGGSHCHIAIHLKMIFKSPLVDTLLQQIRHIPAFLSIC